MSKFERTEMLIGAEAVEKLKNSHVAVFGAGGVGGHAIEGLVRSGLGEITIIDMDTVSVTNINRQALATVSTVGMAKVDAALYGHTHRANVEYTTPWMINPGAAENDCCALLEIENGKPHVKMINLGFN